MVGCAVALVASQQPAATVDRSLPSAEEVLAKVVERAELAGTGSQNDYSCTKQTIEEELDASGEVVKRKLHVSQTHSDPGGVADAHKWSNENGFSLNQELLRRYHFTVVQRLTLHGRPTLLLTFRPKDPPSPVHGFQDRLLNRVVGTLWVDEQDSELAKADLCLVKPVSFGLLGAVDRFTFSFERFRGDDGHWMARWTDTWVKARKFIVPVRTRKRVDWTDFRKSALE